MDPAIVSFRQFPSYAQGACPQPSSVASGGVGGGIGVGGGASDMYMQQQGAVF